VSVVVSVLHTQFLVRSRTVLHLEILALRHQLAVANRSRRPRLRFTTIDRVLWAWLSQRWHGWSAALHVVQPATVLAWHRRGFRRFWARLEYSIHLPSLRSAMIEVKKPAQPLSASHGASAAR